MAVLHILPHLIVPLFLVYILTFPKSKALCNCTFIHTTTVQSNIYHVNLTQLQIITTMNIPWNYPFNKILLNKEMEGQREETLSKILFLPFEGVHKFWEKKSQLTYFQRVIKEQNLRFKKRKLISLLGVSGSQIRTIVSAQSKATCPAWCLMISTFKNGFRCC